MPSPKRAALGLGQRYMWLRQLQVPTEARHDAHIVAKLPMPPGVSVAQIRTTLGYLVRRHEALRTTYHCDADGDPWQEVHPPTAVELVEATVEADRTPAPAEVVARLSQTAFDLAVDRPLRACVITGGGAPRQLVLVLNHMAFDFWSLDRFWFELEALGSGLAQRRPASLAPVRYQPLDLVAYEGSADALALREKAAGFWAAEVARLPRDQFAARRRRAVASDAVSATLTSPELLQAGRRIADRARLWPFAVHVAVYTALMAAYTGSDRIGCLGFRGNRDDAYSDVLTCRFSPLLTLVDCSGDPPFSELLRRVAENDATVGEQAAPPYDELLELLAREGRTLTSELNFLSEASHESRARRTMFVRNPAPAAWAEFGADTYTRINELRDAVAVTLQASAAVMDAEAVERFLRGYEAAMLALAEADCDLRVSEIGALAGFGAAENQTAERPTVEADPEALQAMLAAVAQANNLPAANPDSAYVAEGRVLRIPRALDLLAAAGFTGLTVRDLASAEPLRGLAARLSRADRE